MKHGPGSVNVTSLPMSSAEDFLTRPLLRQLAGEKVYAEGETCVGEGHVTQVQFGVDRVTARVAGTRVHRVKIWRARGELHFSCSCPAGREHTVCQHGVAVGLTWIQSAERGTAAEPGDTRDTPTREKLARHLRGLDRERLVSLLLEATDYDDILRRRLTMEIIGVAGARTGEPRPDFAAYRQILRDAINAPDYVDYDAMPDYVHGLAEALHPLGELLRAGHAATVVDLVELALVELDRAVEMLDASDGSLNAVYDDLQLLHLQACRAARPDPAQLAARLLHFELEGGLGVFNNAAKTYAEILGPAGLAAWRTLLMGEWSNLPALSPAPSGRRSAPPSLDHRRFQVQALMETLAVAEGDFETLSAIKQRDLSSPHDFLSLAEWHQTAGRDDEAITWGVRGLQAFPDPDDHAGLRDFLVAAYHRAGRHDEAAALAWEPFARSQSLERYRQLKHFTRDASGGWPAWRERALQWTRRQLEQARHLHQQRGWPDAPDHSLLVDFLLDDDLDEDAWREAKSGGCRPELWLRLAERRERTHPADALEIYQTRLGPMIAQGGPRAYKEAIALLTRISALLEDLGRIAEYHVYRAEVRATHRQKRSFVKLLDASGH